MANEYVTSASKAKIRKKKRKKNKSVTNVGTTERILSVLGGAALTYFAVQQWNKPAGKGAAALGSSLLFRGTTGFCPVNQVLHRDTAHQQTESGVEIKEVLTISRPRAEVYSFWRQLENLPRFMQHLEQVTQVSPKQSHWVARAPKGALHPEWDAEIVQEVENKLLAWHSLPGADIENAGEVRFEDAPNNGETEIRVHISYWPPAGAVGKGLAHLLNPALANMVKLDLRRFKRMLEAGENPYTGLGTTHRTNNKG